MMARFSLVMVLVNHLARNATEVNSHLLVEEIVVTIYLVTSSHADMMSGQVGEMAVRLVRMRTNSNT